MYTLNFEPSVVKTMQKYKRSTPLLYKKLSKLLEDIALHPREGIGHPEPLKGGNNVTYSRRITAHDRVIYDIHDETINVFILEVGGHYNDK